MAGTNGRGERSFKVDLPAGAQRLSKTICPLFLLTATDPAFPRINYNSSVSENTVARRYTHKKGTVCVEGGGQ